MSEKIRAYIFNVRQALDQLREKRMPREFRVLLDLAESYLSDAQYYFEKGDEFTALACIGYAEGLIDSLRHLGVVEIDWKPLSSLLKRPKVVVAGSFEILHPGHLWLLKHAWVMGEVYVIVSRDVNFEKYKGRKPVVPEKDRLEVVKAIKYVSHAVLGDMVDILKPIEEIKPDIILLGPDQWVNEEDLLRKLEERGLFNIKVVRLPERLGDYSSSAILARATAISFNRKQV